MAGQHFGDGGGGSEGGVGGVRGEIRVGLGDGAVSDSGDVFGKGGVGGGGDEILVVREGVPVCCCVAGLARLFFLSW